MDVMSRKDTVCNLIILRGRGIVMMKMRLQDTSSYGLQSITATRQPSGRVFVCAIVLISASMEKRGGLLA